jgi:hypothetical protein
MNDYRIALVILVLIVAVSWGVVAGLKWGLLAAFGWSPFEANGTEILLGAVLLVLTVMVVEIKV